MPALTSKLDAVNMALEAVWESPVSSLEGAGTGSAPAMARRKLDETNLNVQSRGWAFNTEYGLTLTPDVNGSINVPSNTLTVDTIDEDASVDVVQRGTRLYNRGDHTYQFTKAVKVMLVTALDFEELPQVARQYIALMAARSFKEKWEHADPSAPTAEEAEALRNLEEAEGITGDHNMLTDSWSVAQIIDR